MFIDVWHNALRLQQAVITISLSSLVLFETYEFSRRSATGNDASSISHPKGNIRLLEDYIIRPFSGII